MDDIIMKDYLVTVTLKHKAWISSPDEELLQELALEDAIDNGEFEYRIEDL